MTETVGGIAYGFASWSDGRAATHTVNIPNTNWMYAAAYTGICRATTYSSSVLGDAPSVYWRLGDTGGAVAADTSGKAQPGTYLGGAASGQVGALRGDANTAVSLDGSNDAVIRNPISGISGTALSADLWLKTPKTTWDAGIVSYATSSSPAEFQLRDPQALAVYVKGRRVNTGVAVNDGLWHHLAVTWSSVAARYGLLGRGPGILGSVRSGAPLTAGGALVLGQDRDWVGAPSRQSTGITVA